ncbi:uncharacterized protein LOC123411455 isoform X2 [Hordeum vulgare subsp. vulgare]|uniref:uncharacterized protein LOC123411455 isoform X2 n=1 Tax=Hordeum vulgare subsp. vulgare TaxID=112509 RepID=UPI001D1A548F|nr:uncharacterized protein LOC123411455 isoform X2 [Hordeum vulgare subsp. vulgare]
MDGSMESESPTLYEYEPTNIFSLDLVLEGFLLKEQSGRKSYVKGKTITWNVDSEYFTMDVLMDGLGAELRVGRNQSVTVWYFDMIMAQDVRLTHKDQLHVMFHMYKAEKKLTLTVVVLDNSDSETPVPIIDNVVHVPEATIADNDVLLMGMQDFPLKQSAQVDPSTLVLETDPFDMVEEYVGVDDEYMYVVEPSAPVPVESIEQGNKIWEEEDTGADVFVHHEEEEVIDIDPAGYTVVHDAENPDIRVGALFPDIVTFRKSIRQHAILVGFKLAKIKTDKTRFMAECAHGPCPWRIHASTLQDGRTVMIKTLPFEHNCPTTKLSICTMASQGWIADKIGDWVKKNPGVGAKDAKGKLEDEFNIKLKYNKAWDGMKQTVAGRPRVQRIRGWLEPGRKIVKCKRCGEPGHMQKTCKIPNPEYMAVDDDIPIEDSSTPTNKRKKCDGTTTTTDGDAGDDEVLINLIRKRARTTPQKRKEPEKTNTSAKKTPVKIVAVQEMTKKKSHVKKASSQEKSKKTTKGKKVKKNVPFAPVIPPPPPPSREGQPTNGAKRSLLYWLGG